MADRPILFSAQMVRAIITEVEKPGTGKTQTRRLASRQDIFLRNCVPFCPTGVHSEHRFVPRFDVGDRLWVRETTIIAPPNWTSTPTNPMGPYRQEVVHCANHKGNGVFGAARDYGLKKRPGIHMPRWASRLTLHVTGVKVERLQDISESDAKAEGVDRLVMEGDGEAFYLDNERGAYRCGFAGLWEHINGTRKGAGWDENPWIVAITFKPVLANIDAPAARILEAA